MRRNLSTRLPRRKAAPMSAFDRLPSGLRNWLHQAVLPWSAASALRAWQRALRDCGCETTARARLSAMEARLIARDAARIWGPAHPALTPDISSFPIPHRPVPEGPATADR
ncbi:DUF6525 family protein [Gemmobacter megaterium]|uniref:DUF6525 family protein n=1 Tax=Gemmobacter megaterium TaxID=1086013 RepID=UPI0009709B38|nr:DUF6525 family protein [Gemmobacter megaterium]